MRQVKPLAPAVADQPALFDLATVAAIKATYAGAATERQQIVAMEWVIRAAANVPGISYRAGDSHATAFLEGRRFVGAQILSLIGMDINKLKDDK